LSASTCFGNSTILREHTSFLTKAALVKKISKITSLVGCDAAAYRAMYGMCLVCRGGFYNWNYTYPSSKECRMFSTLTSLNSIGRPERFQSHIHYLLHENRLLNGITVDLSGTWHYGKALLKSSWKQATKRNYCWPVRHSLWESTSKIILAVQVELRLKIVFSKKNWLRFSQRYFGRRMALGNVSCACPYTASAQSYQQIHPPLQLTFRSLRIIP
jgi:hypothetical protein